MRCFWTLAARHWPLATARRRLDAVLGEERVCQLVAAGLLQVEALREAHGVACRTCGRRAELVAEGEALVAVCPAGEGCPTEPFPADAERLVMDAAHVARVLAGALALEGTPGAPGAVVTLGERDLGSTRVAFDLVPRPSAAGVQDAILRRARGGPELRLLLVPDRTRLPADVPREAGTTLLCWMGLGDVFRCDAGTVVADLGVIATRAGLRGVVPDAPFDGLLVMPTGVTLAGHAVPLDRSPLAQRLLHEFAQRPGEFVPRRTLWRLLYADDHTREGRVARGVNPDDLDDRLRAVIAELRRALRATPDGEAAAALIENRRGDPDAGGYRLDLHASRVRLA